MKNIDGIEVLHLEPNAEPHPSQWVSFGEYKKLKDQLRDYVHESETVNEMRADIDKYRLALEKIINGLDEKGPRVIAYEALGTTVKTKGE